MIYSQADLSHRNFNGKVLVNCNFSASNLTSASLKRSDLSYGLLEDANLAHAWFDGAVMDFAKLIRASATNGSFLSSSMRGVNLRDCVFQECDFRFANLRDACLQGAKLINCDFSDAILINANLRGADLSSSNFTNAILLGADLTNAIFDNTVLIKCKVTVKQLTRTASSRGMFLDKHDAVSPPTDEEIMFLENYKLENELLLQVAKQALLDGRHPKEYIDELFLKSLRPKTQTRKQFIRAE